ncbi:RHS repeat-associated core domain-containing protein [Hymenobacter sp. H14-R3]|uniref:DUF6531 domain-containing protein n=1 Tax=Hymenobacter sp. H14-R3 TaxID=3046308 RepID=UPI0024BBB64F|nr:RHS repeat-associated core domain-containing protein [Hymenobacter sp. H14-R3]MDJ0367930.1 RHS repeat-associated core domain-containing protein [Hymenobacter sp. H14-R3]
MAKKYVPAGVFLTCNRGTLPTTLNVVFNARSSIYGQNLATDLDCAPVVNVPPMGVCSMSKMPCVLLPKGKWRGAKDNVQIGMGHPLLEDSQLDCGLGGCISIHFSMADAQAACPPPPTPEKSVFDEADDKLQGLPGPLKDYARFQLGIAEGVWEGGKGLAEGLWGLAKGGWGAITHPADTAKAIAENTEKAYKWAGDGQNWANAADNTKKGIGDAATWASNGENWQQVGGHLQHMSPRDWGKVTGHVAFEVGTAVATAGALEALNVAAKTSTLARVAVRAIELTDVQGLALKGAGKLAGTLAGKMRVLGKVLTGAKRAEQAAARLLKLKHAVANSPLAQKLKGAALATWNRLKCLHDPVDVASGVMLFDQVDLELPGPLPLVWGRWWYSNSAHNGPLGWGWHHSYDATLLANETEVAVRLPDGRLSLFAVPVGDERVFNRAERLELSRDGADYRLWSLDERHTYCFTPLAADGPRPLGTVAATPNETAYRLAQVVDANGFATALAYDERGQLRTLTDGAGRQVRLQHDAHGHITVLEAPEAEGSDYAVLVRYAYDEAGHLLTVTDALGQVQRYAYRPDHLLTRKTLRAGISFYFEYAGGGTAAQCVRTWGDGDVLSGQLDYRPGRTTDYGPTPGAVNIYEHADGLLTRHTDPLGAVRTREYTPYGELALERNPLGQATAYTYDARGNQTQVTYPDGTKTRTQYNAQDLPVQTVNALGSTWQWTYDEAGNMLTSHDPLGRGVGYTYDQQGRLVALTDAVGQATRLRYDAREQLMQVTAPDGARTSYEYDGLGRLTRRLDAAGLLVRQQTYDVLGRVVAVQAADGRRQTRTYDGGDNVLAVREAEHLVQFTYTGLGQVASRTEAGARVVFGYDAQGNLTHLVNEHGDTYTLTRDAAGQVVTETGFDGLTRHYERDAAGQVTQVRRPAERFTRYAYDPAGQVTEVVHHDGTQVRFTYRSDGELLTATTRDCAVHLEKDALGGLLGERQGVYAVTSSYNAFGQRQSLCSSLGADVQLSRDATGQLAQVRADAWQARFAYDAFGQEVERVLSGVQQGWQHDAQGRPVQQTIRPAQGGHPRQRRYRWQGLDQLAELSDSQDGTTTFGYDAWRNLATATYADGEAELRQPDAVGNLFRTPERADRRYGKGGQLREANGTRYRYDAEGNLTRKTLPDGQQWHYAWDGAGQLVEVTRPDGYAVTFAYDAFGRRVSKRFRGKVTRWVWDGSQPLHEWQELEVGPGAGSVQDLTTWLFEEHSFAPLAKLTEHGAYSVVSDHLGTPLALYDRQGKVTWEMSLDSYGAVRQGKGRAQDCPFRYQGQYEDMETGLYYNRFRYYDPAMGSYLSHDPLGLVGGFNLYSYVADPNLLIDPFGWYSDLNHNGLGHHLVPRRVAGKLSSLPKVNVEMDKLSKERSVAWYPNDPTDTAKLHKQMHRKLIDEGVPLHGGKYQGSADDFFASGKKAYSGITEKGFLKIPKTNTVLFKNLTPGEALEKLHELYKNGLLPCPK